MIVKVTDPNIVSKALSVLRQGGLVVYPTETCYGIGADATNQKAINTLLEYKTRREGKPISVAVSGLEMAEQYVDVNSTALNLYTNYLPGPLTIVSKSKAKVAKGVESEYGTLGIRVPDYALVLDIVKKLGKPITATSANVSYKPKPYSITSLLRGLSQKKLTLIDLIIDAGELPHKETSTVVDTTLNDLTVIRQGILSFGQQKGKRICSVQTSEANETRNLASMIMLRYLDKLNSMAMVFALGGELGSGKTQFAKGLAVTLGIKQIVKSPTFSLVDQYPFLHNGKPFEFLHVDTWRLANTKEFMSLNLETYFLRGNVIAIEWADKFFPEIEKLSREYHSFMLKVQLDQLGIDRRVITIEEVPPRTTD